MTSPSPRPLVHIGTVEGGRVRPSLEFLQYLEQLRRSSGLQLFAGRVPAAAAAIYTASAATEITGAAVVNTTGGAVDLSVWIVPAGGTVGAGTAIYSASSIAAGATVDLTALVGQWMARRAVIHAEAGAATSLTLTLSGRPS